MRDLEEARAQVIAWLQPLAGDAPCGPDLEYDNDFLALTQAAAGKPETQFAAAEPADWRQVVDLAARLFERTRDLRVAIEWLRGAVQLEGYVALPLALSLINGLIENFWDSVHPLPDPDDGDPYGRVNALTMLREHAAALGDIRQARVVDDRAAGVLRAGDIEAALGQPGAGPVQTEFTRDQAARMLAVAVAADPGLRAACNEATAQARKLVAAVNERLGNRGGPDLRPLYTVANAVASLLPVEAAAAAEMAAGEAGADSAIAVHSRALSGSVGSREDALRAIDLVIEYLERAEPTNPAPLFLRRARQLVGHNFLQLMKVLAPDALAEVARVVGVDPDTVTDPNAAA